MDSKTEEIHIILDRLDNADPGVAHSALSMLVQKLRSSTSVASSIPKILLYLISKKDSLKERFSTLQGENKRIMADILSVVSATSEGTDTLRYRVEGGATSLDIWGHQYIKKLSSDIICVYKENKEGPRRANAETDEIDGAGPDEDKMDGVELEAGSSKVGEAVPEGMEKILPEVLECLFKFNSECDAVDLLIEVDLLHLLPKYADADNTDRIAAYLSSLTPYLGSEVRGKAESTLIEIYRSAGKVQEYVSLMVRSNQKEALSSLLAGSRFPEQLQIAYAVAKHSFWVDSSNEQIREIVCNRHVKKILRYVAEKMELAQEKNWGYGVFGEGLVKASFSKESIPEQENKKTYKITSQSSKGLLYLWDPEEAMQQVEQNLFSEDGYLKVSSLLALSISSCRMLDESETVLAISRESFETNSVTQKLVLLQALVLQYAGSMRTDVYELVKLQMQEEQEEVALFAIYAAGAVLAGSCNTEAFTEAVQALGERQWASPLIRHALLGISLIFLCGETEVEGVLSAAESIEGHEVSLPILMRSLAYLGTGNAQVLKEILKSSLDESSPAASEEEEQEDTLYEYKHVFSILGIALVSLGEDTLVQMGTHVLEGAMILDVPTVQSAVPLALGLLHMSSAKVEVIETLKRCLHSGDASVIVSSLAGLGMVAAGSSNSRVQSALEQMASLCTKATPANVLNTTEGLLRLGKGTLRLSLFVDGVPCKKAIACALGFVFALVGGGAQIIDKYYFMMSLLAPCIMPKFLVAVDETGSFVEPKVRVGTRVDVSGVAGRPKRISGSQVHSAPILLQPNEAAEILGAAPVYCSSSSVVVIPNGCLDKSGK